MKNTSANTIELSPYGYGMMSFATAVAILLANGLFEPGKDLTSSWSLAAFAGAAGALALLKVKTYFPNLTTLQSLVAATGLNVFMFSACIISFYGYAYSAAMRADPSLMSDSIAILTSSLQQALMSMVLAATLATITYVFLQKALWGITHMLSPAPQSSSN